MRRRPELRTDTEKWAAPPKPRKILSREVPKLKAIPVEDGAEQQRLKEVANIVAEELGNARIFAAWNEARRNRGG